MDEVVVFLIILIIAAAILWFLLKILIGTIVIWGGALMLAASSFAWGLKSKWSRVNSPEKASGWVTLAFDGKVKWQTREPAFQTFLEVKKFAAIGAGLGFVWIIVSTAFGQSHDSKSLRIIFALALTTVAMRFIIQGYSSLMRLKVMDGINQAGHHLGRLGEIGVIEGKIAATSKRMDFEFPLEFSRTLQSFAENNAVTLISDLTPLDDEIAKVEADANGVLASLEDAERDLNRAKAAYEETSQVVAICHSIELLPLLGRIQLCLSSTALTNSLAARKWQDFKKEIAAQIDLLGCVTKLARDYGAESGGKDDASRTQGGMSKKRALELLNVPDEYSRTDVEEAFVKAMSACHPDRYRGLSPTVISHMDELSKDLGEAKSVLLEKFKDDL